MNTNKIRAHLALAAVAGAALVAACGGGGGGGGIGSGGTGAAPGNGLAVGTVNGFGSIFVGGVRCDDTRAKVSYTTTAGAPAAGVPDVKLGQHVEIVFDPAGAGCKVLEAMVDPEVVGLVSSVSPLVVAGQQVAVVTDASVAPPTVFEGLADAGALKPGDRVEVHGNRLAGGVLQASRIERKPATDTWVRVKGTVSAAGASQFTLGALTVKLDGATTFDPAGSTPADGQTVIVWSTGAVAGDGSVTARAVRVAQRSLDDEQAVRVEGPVTGCSASPCTTPHVDGLAVDLAGAVWDAGSAADVANGASLRVEGTWNAAGSHVVATRASVRSQDATAADVTLIGMVADYVSGTSFTVRGVPVTTDGATTFGSGCAVTPGQIVGVKGHVQSSQVVATSVNCLTLTDGTTLDIFGGLLEVDTTAKTFKLTEGAYKDYTLTWDDDTLFGNGLAGASLASGVRVGLRAVLVEGKLLVKRMVADPVPSNLPPGVQVFGNYGIAHDVGAASLAVGSITMNIVPGTTTVVGTVVDGTQVRTWFYRTSGSAPWTALQVTQLVWN